MSIGSTSFPVSCYCRAEWSNLLTPRGYDTEWEQNRELTSHRERKRESFLDLSSIRWNLPSVLATPVAGGILRGWWQEARGSDDRRTRGIALSNCPPKGYFRSACESPAISKKRPTGLAGHIQTKLLTALSWKYFSRPTSKILWP